MNSDTSKPALVGIDWGTSSLRAYLMDSKGVVLDKLESEEGIMKVPDKQFEIVLQGTVGDWLKQRMLPIIASGMITSRNGWLETPYQSIPTNAEQLASALVPLRTNSGLELHFVTGVSTEHSGSPDVIRGEETQIVGAISSGIGSGRFVMPGTHSKWVKVSNDCIDDFATYMSGEVYEVLCQHTILGTLMQDGKMKDGNFCEPQFKEGVKKGLESGSKLLNTLFHVRTLPLFGKMDEEAVADYLSGMLIGAEISAATNGQTTQESVTIIGRNDLANRYAIALSVAGLTSNRTADDIITRGHFAIATSAGLLA